MIKHLKINTPIWKDRSVGIATYLLRDCDAMEVEILYTTKDGKRLYPNPFYMPIWEIRKYPIQGLGNVKVRVVPIHAMQEIIKVPQ